MNSNFVTVVVLIGNTDGRLSRAEWADYCREVLDLILKSAIHIHFRGGSAYSDPWEGAAWVFDLQEIYLEFLQEKLTVIRTRYRQDSIALIQAQKTIFL